MSCTGSRVAEVEEEEEEEKEKQKDKKKKDNMERGEVGWCPRSIKGENQFLLIGPSGP